MSMDVGSKGVKSDINVTPLVDVVLVLLIIFMVITPMLQRGKAVTLPDAKMVSELKSGGDPIILARDAHDGDIGADGRPVPSGARRVPEDHGLRTAVPVARMEGGREHVGGVDAG